MECPLCDSQEILYQRKSDGFSAESTIPGAATVRRICANCQLAGPWGSGNGGATKKWNHQIADLPQSVLGQIRTLQENKAALEDELNLVEEELSDFRRAEDGDIYQEAPHQVLRSILNRMSSQLVDQPAYDEDEVETRERVLRAVYSSLFGQDAHGWNADEMLEAISELQELQRDLSQLHPEWSIDEEGSQLQDPNELSSWVEELQDRAETAEAESWNDPSIVQGARETLERPQPDYKWNPPGDTPLDDLAAQMRDLWEGAEERLRIQRKSFQEALGMDSEEVAPIDQIVEQAAQLQEGTPKAEGELARVRARLDELSTTLWGDEYPETDAAPVDKVLWIQNQLRKVGIQDVINHQAEEELNDLDATVSRFREQAAELLMPHRDDVPSLGEILDSIKAHLSTKEDYVKQVEKLESDTPAVDRFSRIQEAVDEIIKESGLSDRLEELSEATDELATRSWVRAYVAETIQKSVDTPIRMDKLFERGSPRIKVDEPDGVEYPESARVFKDGYHQVAKWAGFDLSEDPWALETTNQVMRADYLMEQRIKELAEVEQIVAQHLDISGEIDTDILEEQLQEDEATFLNSPPKYELARMLDTGDDWGEIFDAVEELQEEPDKDSAWETEMRNLARSFGLHGWQVIGPDDIREQVQEDYRKLGRSTFDECELDLQPGDLATMLIEVAQGTEISATMKDLDQMAEKLLPRLNEKL